MIGGWLVSLKNWHTPLYVRTEAPERHVAWTGHKHEAMRFRHRKDAVTFLERLGERVDKCQITFYRRIT